MSYKKLFLITAAYIISFKCLSYNTNIIDNKTTNKIVVGAERTSEYIFLLKDKRVGIVANQTSVISKSSVSPHFNYTHIVDSLINSDINIIKIFTPEHGYKGQKPNGANIKDEVDKNTGLEIISLHGENRKYGKILDKDLEDIDILIFDIQDVGTRFYTHISTLHYVMQSCAENDIPLIVLDRPNPNINYVDGPILEKENKSFVGMHEVPIVYGMTIGEYANMINGEKWFGKELNCKINVIKILNYNRSSKYSLPIKPSPNLPNDQSISLYPSLCLFEGTNVSVGRGTENQFTIYGSPYLNNKIYNYSFVPKPNLGSKFPKNESQICYGENLEDVKIIDKIELKYIINAYNNSTEKKMFFNSFFIKLSGTSKLKNQIINNISENKIRESWIPGLIKFKKMRTKYLYY